MTIQAVADLSIPEGFVQLDGAVGFDHCFNAICFRESDGEMVLGFRVGAQHLNRVGSLHGAAIALIADWQVVSAKMKAGIADDIHTPTISLQIDYLAPGVLGDWVELHVCLQKQTRTMLFTSGDMFVDGELIARSRAIYRVLKAGQ